MKWISTVESEYKVGKVDDEIIGDARNAGLSELGIQAMITGDKRTFKLELDKLERLDPGSIWAYTAGYGLWFNAANPGEQNADYRRIERELKCLPR